MRSRARGIATKLVDSLNQRSVGFRTRFWRIVYGTLPRWVGPEVTVLNYGYSPLDDDPALREAPECFGYQMYRQVFREGTRALTSREGLHLLEVGCGRGGGLIHLTESFSSSLSRTCGLDFSPTQIEFCRRNRRGEFLVRDAGGDWNGVGEFDMIINVESSHCYPDRQLFFENVRAHLKDDESVFVWTDLVPTDRLPEVLEVAVSAGLRCTKVVDITAHVLDACRADDARRRSVIQDRLPAAIRKPMGEMAALQDSKTFSDFLSGTMLYPLCVFRKAGSRGREPA